MLDIKQKKKHLLLLNRIMRTELKKDIIPFPSKLTEEEVNKYFDRLFVKKEDYYVPIKSKVELKIDEELFKALKPKTKEDKIKMKEEAKMKKDEMQKSVSISVYNKFNKEFIIPYATKRKAGEDVSKEEQELIKRYIKLSQNVKSLIKKNWINLYNRLLEPADKERNERKEKLKEEDKKLMMDIKDKAKEEKKTEPEKVLEEPKQENIKHKIIKEYYKNNILFYDIRNNIKDITNDNILNWFDSKNEYYKFRQNYTRSELTQYFEDLERIQDEPKEQKNKLKNLNIITVDVSNYREQTIKKHTDPTDIYNISFGKLDINTAFRTEMKKEFKILYEKDLNIYKNLPNEKQIYDLLKQKNVKFDYFVYIFHSTYSEHSSLPTKYKKGDGYDIKKEYLYNENGELVKIIRDNKTTADVYGILEYFTK